MFPFSFFSCLVYTCFFSTQTLLNSDPVTTILQAAAKGSQVVVQLLAKQLVNVEDKVCIMITEKQQTARDENGNIILCSIGKGKKGLGVEIGEGEHALI